MAPYACTIVDGAYCVVKWGKNFCKDFAEMEKVWSFMVHIKPFLITSAMLPPLLLQETMQLLEYNHSKTFTLNLGNNCPNIILIICKIQSSVKDLTALNWVIAKACKGKELECTIVFTNQHDNVHCTYAYLVAQVPGEYKSQIAFTHAFRSPHAHCYMTCRLCKGRIRILITTEVTGMVSKHNTVIT